MNLMDVIDCVAYCAAKKADPDHTAQEIASAQKIWDSGESFIYDPAELLMNVMPKQRVSDSPEEVEAAAQSVNAKLSRIALSGAMRDMDRNTAMTLLHVLSSIDPEAQLTIFGTKLDAYAFRIEWNEQHPESAI